MAITHQARVYAYGGVAAAFNGAVNSLALLIVAPETFNFSGGLKKLAIATAVSAGVGLVTFLKQHPLPVPADSDFQQAAQARISAIVASNTGTGGVPGVLSTPPVALKLE